MLDSKNLPNTFLHTSKILSFSDGAPVNSSSSPLCINCVLNQCDNAALNLVYSLLAAS